jgi:formiminotetrahydrofolate cyclodeaminase
MASGPLPLQTFLANLAAKQPTPGGGAAAAIGASIGSAAASMAAAYTQRKKDRESGAADRAESLIAAMEIPSLLKAADDDAVAYADLQRTWNEESNGMSADEKAAIEARALAIPTNLLVACHSRILQIHDFLPHCNPSITSDAKVGIHQLAGAARAAYQVSDHEFHHREKSTSSYLLSFHVVQM